MLKTIIPAALVAAMSYPAMAQDVGDPLDPADAKEAMTHDGLTPEQQAEYAAWPTEVRAYYQALPPERQKLFWRMSDADKMSLIAMSAEEQEAVWQGIEALPKSTVPMTE